MKFVFLFVFLIFNYNLFASDSLKVELTKKTYQKGDSIEIHISVPNYQALKLKAATAHIWIDNIKTNKRYKFRYPLIEGELNAALLIEENIEEGNYAVNCIIQSGFYKMIGHLNDKDKKDSVINYLMKTSNKKSIVDQVRVDKNGDFIMKSMLFQDKASFYFSPTQKTKNNYLSITLKTPIDSAFEPIVSGREFFAVGNNVIRNKLDAYQFILDDTTNGSSLGNVTVYSKTKSKMQDYEDNYVSGLFRNENAYSFDGLESEELANSPTLGWFLQQKVPGLTVVVDSSFTEVFKWREEICSIFIDEFEVLPGEHTIIFPRDIAMLKVFRPPFQYSSSTGFGGAIAIYTRKGKYGVSNSSKYSFILKGYTPFDSSWN